MHSIALGSFFRDDTVCSYCLQFYIYNVANSKCACASWLRKKMVRWKPDLITVPPCYGHGMSLWIPASSCFVLSVPLTIIARGTNFDDLNTQNLKYQNIILLYFTLHWWSQNVHIYFHDITAHFTPRTTQEIVMKALGAEVVRAPSAPFGTPGKEILSLQRSLKCVGELGAH